MISFSNVFFSYKTSKVLKNITLEFKEKEFVLIIGKNGTGKTTLLNLISGLITPSKGNIRRNKNKRINLFSEKTFLYNCLTVKENIEFFSKLTVSNSDQQELSRWNLESVLDKKINTLSKGYKVRVSLCRTFLNIPEIVLLDEPTSFLDESSLLLFKKNISEYRRKFPYTLFIVCSHDLIFFKDQVTRVIYLESGKVINDTLERTEINDVMLNYQVQHND